MSRRTRLVCSAFALVALLAAVLLAVVRPALAAKDKGHTLDLVKIAPDFAARGVNSIAMLPVVTYDANPGVQHMVASYWGQNFKDTGYRWVSPATAVVVLHSTLGDSVIGVVRDEILKNARVDSLRAPQLCAKLHASSLLSVRVDQWEQTQITWDQSGKPTTSIRLKAALVDSMGIELWSISGSEYGEGLYNDPSTNPIGVKLHPSLVGSPITGEGGPPRFEDVLTKLLVRWATELPKAPAAPEAAK
jgi:hypothetical protein